MARRGRGGGLMSRQNEQLNQARIGAALRAEADSHRPDRAAMLARIERGQFSAPAPVRGRRRRTSRRSGLRLAGIVMASAVGFGLSVAGTWAAVGVFSAPAPTEPVVTVVSPSPSDSAAP